MNLTKFTLGAGMLAGLLLCSGCFFQVDSEFLALRDELLPSTDFTYKKEFQHKFGGTTLGMARRFVDHADDPDAVMVLRCIDSVQVGVFALQAPAPGGRMHDQARQIDRKMSGKGFYPVVRVREVDEQIAIFALEDGKAGLEKLYIFVMEPTEVVMVLLDGKLDPMATHLARGEYARVAGVATDLNEG